MKGKDRFSRAEAQQIRALLPQKENLTPDEQKKVRDKLRALGFYISDFKLVFPHGFTLEDFDLLVVRGRVVIEDVEGGATQPRELRVSSSPVPVSQRARRAGSDEHYVLDLCNEVLDQQGQRQYRGFDFLCGDAGTRLPVDAYYPRLKLVVEYRERQHDQPMAFFDKPDRLTVSGVHRGEQRKRYDQLRRDLLPLHGFGLLELSYTDFAHSAAGRLKRDRVNDERIVREKLEPWLRKEK